MTADKKNVNEKNLSDAKNKDVSTMQDDLAGIMTKKSRFTSTAIGDSNKNPSGQEIKRELVEVYADADGKIPDLSKLENTARPLWKSVIYFLIILFTLIIVASVAGFLFFANKSEGKFTNERVSLKIQPPLNIVSGQEMEYVVSISNQERVNLYNAELSLTYPENFELISAEPVSSGDQKNNWQFSVLRVGEQEQIKITGRIVGSLKNTETFKGVLTYKPANMNAVFNQESIVDAAITDSVVGIDIVGPESILANQVASYTVRCLNLSPKDLSDLQVVLTYPDGFVPDKFIPDPKQGSDNIWNINKLVASSSQSIVINGNYSAATENGNKNFQAQLLWKKDDDYYPQAEKSVVTNVVKDQLSLQLIVNGSAGDQPINFGDTLTYSLSYKNTGQEDLKNIQLVANLSSDILDWTTLKDSHKGIKKGNTITWTGKEVPQLLKLGPGAEGEISWSIRVADASALDNDKIAKFNVESFIEGQSNQKNSQSTVKTKTIVNAINSNLSLGASSRYYNEDNVALGSGSIQPKVGEKSVYNIIFSLANNLNDVKDVMLVVTLPKSAEWTNQENHSTGDLIYNKQSNKITWNIARLAKSATKTNLDFNVGIKPTEDDFGRVLILVSEANLTATDANTGAEVTSTIKAITTALDDPILGQTTGVVK